MDHKIDSISIDGHHRRDYSEDEKKELSFKFITTLHFLLIAYLTLHNLLIPLVINIARGNFIFTDVHFWFLIQVPLYLKLKKSRTLDSVLFSAIALGVAVRLGVEMILVTKFKSWGMLSIYITEVATLIFVVAAYSVYRPKIRWQGILLALALIPLCSIVEVRSDWSKSSIVREKKIVIADNSGGCEGSLIEFNSAHQLKNSPDKDLLISSCGFLNQQREVNDDLVIKNTRSNRVSFRLFKLHLTNKVPNWRFVRLYVLAPKEELTLSAAELTKERLFLLKSPEMKSLGQTLIINSKRFNEIPKGSYRLDSVSIQFGPEELK